MVVWAESIQQVCSDWDDGTFAVFYVFDSGAIREHVFGMLFSSDLVSTWDFDDFSLWGSCHTRSTDNCTVRSQHVAS